MNLETFSHAKTTKNVKRAKLDPKHTQKAVAE